jgi:acyl-CoA thioesterase
MCLRANRRAKYGGCDCQPDALVDLLDLEALEVNLCRGFSPDEKRLRVFGSQVAAKPS